LIENGNQPPETQNDSEKFADSEEHKVPSVFWWLERKTRIFARGNISISQDPVNKDLFMKKAHQRKSKENRFCCRIHFRGCC
jgi:hypothetical protein